MTDPFAAALGALFRSPGSVAAVYTPPGGQPLPIRIIRSQDSREAVARGGGRIIRDTNVIEIQRTDVDQPVKGAGVAIGGESFRLAAGAELDVEGITWICPLEPA